LPYTSLTNRDWRGKFAVSEGTQRNENTPIEDLKKYLLTFGGWARRGNRGLLLDLFVFVVNTFLMGILVRQFYEIVISAKQGDESAVFVILLYFISMLVLAPTGAFLKRWHYSERQSAANSDRVEIGDGCLFNPLIYFGLIAVLSGAVGALFFHFIYGAATPPAAAQTVLIIAGLALAVAHTVFVYRYFSPPSRVPRTEFMRGPMSDLIGDICIFLNMLLYQVLWNMLALGFERPKSGADILTDLLALGIGSLLIYFPPRIFYLAEDIRRPWTWLFIVLANLPVIYRAIFGNFHAFRF
jgi:hypothetical protein